MKKNKENLNIELSEEIASGFYSNLAVINHSNTEFVVDFIQVMPGIPKAKVRSRILLSPQHAKRLKLAIEENINKFEEQFGKINDANQGLEIPITFGGPTPQA